MNDSESDEDASRNTEQTQNTSIDSTSSWPGGLDLQSICEGGVSFILRKFVKNKSSILLVRLHFFNKYSTEFNKLINTTRDVRESHQSLI